VANLLYPTVSVGGLGQPLVSTGWRVQVYDMRAVIGTAPFFWRTLPTLERKRTVSCDSELSAHLTDSSTPRSECQDGLFVLLEQDTLTVSTTFVHSRSSARGVCMTVAEELHVTLDDVNLPRIHEVDRLSLPLPPSLPPSCLSPLVNQILLSHRRDPTRPATPATPRATPPPVTFTVQVDCCPPLSIDVLRCPTGTTHTDHRRAYPRTVRGDQDRPL
jgi:hypothetical protein